MEEYTTLDEMEELCGDRFHIGTVHVIGRSETYNTDILTEDMGIYTFHVSHKTNSVTLYVGLSKEIIERTIKYLRANMKHGFNAVSLEEMIEHFDDVNDAIQFIECGKRLGLLEPCGEGFYAF